MPIQFDKKPGIVAYLTAGDPDLATTRDIALAAIDNGADVIELGVPFSDPLADGPVIQRASERAVARGTRLSDVLGLARELRAARPSCGLVLFSYLNPVVQFGRNQAQAVETVQGVAEGEGKYIRRISPSGMYAHVKLRVEPNVRGGGVDFFNDLPGVDHPFESSEKNILPISREYIPDIEIGVREASRGGVVAGNEMMDLRVHLTGGSSHEIESSPMAFRIAASMAFKDAARKAKPTIIGRVSTMKQFCAAAKDAGADGVLLTDMIVEEAGEYLTEMQANSLAPIFLAAPTSPDARLRAIGAASKGFVYAISRVGITGTQDKVASDAPELVARLRKFTTLPIAVGFGISNAAHVKAVGEFADAAIIGSALVALIEKTGPADAAKAVGDFIRALRAN